MGSDEWAVELTQDAEQGLRNLPKEQANKAVTALEQMETQPYAAAAKLKYTGNTIIWRRKKGRLRIIFQVNKSKRKVKILALDLRTDETYSSLDSADSDFND